ncbi:MAG TPA: MATE family efflux transporter [Quisquiliibacterium sp.]|nr:MATE family efflux transporter [Quisquiliibacterium sp.]
MSGTPDPARAGTDAPARTSVPPPHRLLGAPILPSIARLAAPGVVSAVFQTSVSIADTFFVGRLGTEALAGLALVFPMAMLLQMTSSGAMGGGVASAIARNLGGGRHDAARLLVVQALAIAVTLGCLFTLVMLGGGSGLYALLGGRGAVLVWLANTFAAMLRGSGNTLLPSVALSVGSLVHVPLSGALTLGWGPFPQLGIRGAAFAYLGGFGVSAVLMALILSRGALRPRAGDWRLQWSSLRDILRVGAVSSLSSIQNVAASVLLTGFVGAYGAASLAGYGVGVRMELLQFPVLFAIGQALLASVGVHVGAGQGERAKRIAWTGVALAMAVSATLGLSAALFPGAWMRVFSEDPAVIEAGSAYLRIVGPFYPLMAVGMVLYFASQGAGRVVAPVLAGTARLLVVIVGGVLVTALSGPPAGLFAVVALGFVTHGLLTAWAVRRTPWGAPRV